MLSLKVILNKMWFLKAVAFPLAKNEISFSSVFKYKTLVYCYQLKIIIALY